MPFEAKFYQACASCGESVKGHQVIYEGNDLVHVLCDAVAELAHDAKRQTCSECWLLKPCGCEDEAVES